MSEKKTAEQWFADYGEIQPHSAKQLIHWLCVPLLSFSVLGLTWSVPMPEELMDAAPWFNWTLLALLAETACYVRISPRLSAGLAFWLSLCYSALVALELYAPFPVWKICAVIFVLAWIGQLIGHRIEGKQPSFFKDVVFLLIGPAWLMSKIYQKIGQRY